MSSEDYRKKVSEDMKQFATGDVDPDLWEWFVRRIHYLSGKFDDKESLPATQRVAGKDRQGSFDSRQLLLLPGNCAGRFGPDCGKPVGRRADGAKQWSMAPGHHREALRSRP